MALRPILDTTLTFDPCPQPRPHSASCPFKTPLRMARRSRTNRAAAEGESPPPGALASHWRAAGEELFPPHARASVVRSALRAGRAGAAGSPVSDGPGRWVHRDGGSRGRGAEALGRCPVAEGGTRLPGPVRERGGPATPDAGAGMSGPRVIWGDWCDWRPVTGRTGVTRAPCAGDWLERFTCYLAGSLMWLDALLFGGDCGDQSPCYRGCGVTGPPVFLGGTGVARTPVIGILVRLGPLYWGAGMRGPPVIWVYGGSPLSSWGLRGVQGLAIPPALGPVEPHSGSWQPGRGCWRCCLPHLASRTLQGCLYLPHSWLLLVRNLQLTYFPGISLQKVIPGVITGNFAVHWAGLL